MAGKRVALRYEQHINVPTSCFRAVENGCSLVRPTMQGLSFATDPYGRVLAYHDYYSNTPRLTIVGVKSRGVRTIYAMFGDLFSIISVVLFVGLIGFAYRNRDSNGGDNISGRICFNRKESAG